MKIEGYNNLKNIILKLKKGDLEDVPPFFRSKAFSWLLILIFASIITLLATVSLQYVPSGIVEGMIAPRNIKADRNYEITDEEATEKIRGEAIVGILPVYDLEDAVSASIAERIKLAFANARVKYQSQMDLLRARKQKNDLLSEEESEALRNLFAENLGVLPSQAQWKLLLGERLDARSENYLIDLIIKALEKPVIAERVALDAEAANGITVRRKISVDGESSPEIKETTLKDLSHILTTDEARKGIAKIELPNYEFRNPEFASKIKVLAQELIEPNFGLNRLETQKRRDDAALKVKSVVLKVKSGEMIIREGARYEPWHIKVIDGIRNEKSRGMYPLEFIGTFVLVMLFIVFPFYLAERFFRRIRPSKADHILMAFIAISILLIERFYILLAPGLHDAFFFNAPITALHYAIPIAGGAMLLRMYLAPEISMVFALSMSVLSGLLLEADMNFYVYIIMTNLGAVIAVARVDKRSSILKAGLLTGAIGVAAIVGTSMIGFASASMSASFSGMMWGILLSMIGGIACS
ncbi:MAG TPA: hypothetical protein PLT05_03405, partial [bacterium]|nr:hypothetical protein [bacterium]